MAVRHAGVDPLPFGSTSPQAGQIGLGPRFIQEDQLGRVERRLVPAPESAGPENIRPLLFAGVECLFLYVSPILANTTLIACREQSSPVHTDYSSIA